jgi:hypothetical protein
MRYFHLNKNKYHCPIVNLDKLWTLVGEEVSSSSRASRPSFRAACPRSCDEAARRGTGAAGIGRRGRKQHESQAGRNGSREPELKQQQQQQRVAGRASSHARRTARPEGAASAVWQQGGREAVPSRQDQPGGRSAAAGGRSCSRPVWVRQERQQQTSSSSCSAWMAATGGVEGAWPLHEATRAPSQRRLQHSAADSWGSAAAFGATCVWGPPGSRPVVARAEAGSGSAVAEAGPGSAVARRRQCSCRPRQCSRRPRQRTATPQRHLPCQQPGPPCPGTSAAVQLQGRCSSAASN